MIPPKRMTATNRPSCETFLKNCIQESSAVGADTSISIPAGMNWLMISGMYLAASGLMIPKSKNTRPRIKSLYVLVNSVNSFFVNAAYALIVLPP